MAAGPARQRTAVTVPRLPLSGDPAIDGDRIIEGADAVALERGDALHQRHTIGQIAAFGSETAGVRRQLGEHEVAARGGGMAGPVEAERRARAGVPRSEEHTSELQSLMRLSYAVFCLKKKKKNN